MNGTMINTSFHKHIGLTFSDVGSWNEHIDFFLREIMVSAKLVKSSQKSIEKIFGKKYLLFLHTSSFCNIIILFGTTVQYYLKEVILGKCTVRNLRRRNMI